MRTKYSDTSSGMAYVQGGRKKRTLTWVVSDAIKAHYSQQNCLPWSPCLKFTELLRIPHYSTEKVREGGQQGTCQGQFCPGDWMDQGGWDISTWLKNRLLMWQQWGKCFHHNRPPTYPGLCFWLWIQVNRPSLGLLNPVWGASWIFLTAWTPSWLRR